MVVGLLLEDLFEDEAVVDEDVVALDVLLLELVYVLFCFGGEGLEVGDLKREEILHS